MEIGIIGAGSWGSAVAILLQQNSAVMIWSSNQKQVEEINSQGTNSGYLPDGVLFSNVISSTEFSELKKCNAIFIATPSNTLRYFVTKIQQLFVEDDLPDIIWLCKGFELDSYLLPHQVVASIVGNHTRVGALIGPSFAHEVSLGKPTAISLVSQNKEFINFWIKYFQSIPNFKIYANTDFIGSEIGAAVKNIMAIAVGISDGLLLGFNARAALITRSLNEIGILVEKLGGNSKTLFGLTGIGDLILTCTGDLSRNRQVGLGLSQGKKIDDILLDLGHVAEGVLATKIVYIVASDLGLEMPIVESVYNIIYKEFNVKDAVSNLLERLPPNLNFKKNLLL